MSEHVGGSLPSALGSATSPVLSGAAPAGPSLLGIVADDRLEAICDWQIVTGTARSRGDQDATSGKKAGSVFCMSRTSRVLRGMSGGRSSPGSGAQARPWSTP
jgi:hypothetical protein